MRKDMNEIVDALVSLHSRHLKTYPGPVKNYNPPLEVIIKGIIDPRSSRIMNDETSVKITSESLDNTVYQQHRSYFLALKSRKVSIVDCGFKRFRVTFTISRKTPVFKEYLPQSIPTGVDSQTKTELKSSWIAGDILRFLLEGRLPDEHLKE